MKVAQPERITITLTRENAKKLHAHRKAIIDRFGTLQRDERDLYRELCKALRLPVENSLEQSS